MQKKWNILYSEHEWTNPPSKKPYFENNINSFRDVLLSIKELAKKIECENFANIFTSAINLLDGYSEYPDEKYGLSFVSNSTAKSSNVRSCKYFGCFWSNGFVE